MCNELKINGTEKNPGIKKKKKEKETKAFAWFFSSLFFFFYQFAVLLSTNVSELTQVEVFLKYGGKDARTSD